MKKLGIVFGMLALVACGGSDPDPVDAATTPTDTGATPTDTGATPTDTGATPTDTGMVATPDCTSYCTSVMGACTDANAQYGSMDICMAYCATLPVGTAADMAGNTVGCRTYHAGAAGGDAATHCVHAGPGGAGACGTNCEGYCAGVVGICTGANEVYADVAECMTACAGITDDVAYSTAATGGDSLACRIYHLSAATGDAATHCSHTAVASGPCS